jgi:hypothetical protein
VNTAIGLMPEDIHKKRRLEYMGSEMRSKMAGRTSKTARANLVGKAIFDFVDLKAAPRPN